MQLTLPNAHAHVVDEYTGVVTTGGAVTLTSSSPFTASDGRAYGQYLDFDITAIDYCYTYLNFSQGQGQQFITSNKMVVDFMFRVLTFPTDTFDVTMIHTTASMGGVIILRFMKSGSDWFVRVMALQNDNSVLTADTAAQSEAAWKAQAWTFVLTIVPKKGSTAGTVNFTVTNLGHSAGILYTGISNVTNDVMMNYPTSISMGSSSATSSVAQYDIDEVAIQDFTYVPRIADFTPVGPAAPLLNPLVYDGMGTWGSGW
jgi:hypothetical protein